MENFIFCAVYGVSSEVSEEINSIEKGVLPKSVQRSFFWLQTRSLSRQD